MGSALLKLGISEIESSSSCAPCSMSIRSSSEFLLLSFRKVYCNSGKEPLGPCWTED